MDASILKLRNKLAISFYDDLRS